MKRYGLLGERLSHSYSPEIHGLLADYEYKLYEVEREGLDGFFESTALDGFNVTIPYKRDVMKYLAGISDTARHMGSVNTVVRRADGFFGDNTDAYGFEYTVKKSGIDVKGKNVVCVLSGGNIDVSFIQSIIEQGLVARHRRIRFVVRLMDKPGSLVQMLGIVAKAGANILAIEHDKLSEGLNPNETDVHIACEVGGQSHGQRLLDELQNHGYKVFLD